MRVCVRYKSVHCLGTFNKWKQYFLPHLCSSKNSLAISQLGGIENTLQHMMSSFWMFPCLVHLYAAEPLDHRANLSFKVTYSCCSHSQYVICRCIVCFSEVCNWRDGCPASEDAPRTVFVRKLLAFGTHTKSHSESWIPVEMGCTELVVRACVCARVRAWPL